jgi:hypothetical protein
MFGLAAPEFRQRASDDARVSNDVRSFLLRERECARRLNARSDE